MAINIKALNDGRPISNPYGKVSQIPPSFSGVEYYDCYVPYSLTCQQLGGYRIAELDDGGTIYPPMAAAIKAQRVANHPASEGGYVCTGLTQYSIAPEASTKCNVLTKTDSNNRSTKFYLTAVQPFFLRRSVGVNAPTDGYFPYSNANRGQLIDVILTDGTCIHFVLNDVNAMPHTNCGNNQAGTTQFARTSYSQYHNIISCVGGNSLELSHDSNTPAQTALNSFSNKYGLGTWGVNGANDIAFYRVYKTRLSDGFTLANDSYGTLSYTIANSTPTPSPSTTTVIRPVIEKNKGIKGLVVDFDIWKNGTHLIRVGDNVTLKATKDSSGRVTWQDITDKRNPVSYTPLQLKTRFGISYTSVNNGYIGKFEVKQKPLPVELGGTGVRDLSELTEAILGSEDAPGGYDYSGSTMPTFDSATTITPPALLTGHCTTAEARSASRGGLGSSTVGDQAQAHKTKYYDDQGEVSIVYDRDSSDFTALYRLVGNNAKQSADYKIIALSAANHGWFFANNSRFGYNYYSDGEQAVSNYIRATKQSHGYVQFGSFNNTADTNCINFCRLMYAASFPWESKYISNLTKLWTTNGILTSNTLEQLGFKRFSTAYAKNPANYEIGDILLKPGHGALVVDVGGKSWIVNNQDFNPKNGEVKT